MNTPYKLAFLATILITGTSYGQTRYVSATGSDITNDCTNQATPCGTIQTAYTQATEDDSILVFPGNYALSSVLTIAKDGIVLSAQNPLNRPVITTTASDVIVVDAEDVSVNGMIFDMGLTSGSGLRGIVSTGNYNNLKITNNDFNSTKPVSTGMVFASYAVFVSQPMNTTPIAQITVENNNITATAGMDDFGRGLGLGGGLLNGPQGTVSGNTIAAYYAIQAVGTGGDFTVNDNTLTGITMINAPLADADIVFSDNTFSGADATVAANLYSLIEIRAIELGTVSITGNEIRDYSNIGLLSTASRNVTVSANTFTPLATANDFVSLMANTKLMTNGSQANTFSDEITIVSNTFNAGVTATGKAIVIADHYGANTPSFESIVVGGASTLKNTFNADLGSYIVLDDQAGASTAFPLWATYPATTMAPVSIDVRAYASENIYNQASIPAIEAKNSDDLDNTLLGKIILTSEEGNRYVAATGTDGSNACTDADFPCMTIPHAYTQAMVEDTIFIGGGEYALDGTWTIEKEGLVVTSWDSENPAVITSNANDVVVVNAPEVQIADLTFEMGLTSTTGFRGIVATDNYNNLQITGNRFVSVKPLTTGMAWGSYAVSVSTASAVNDTVEIIGNDILIEGTTGDVFSRGLGLGLSTANGPAGEIRLNAIAAYYPIQAIRNTGDLLISENILAGITMLNTPLNDAEITLDDNDLTGGNAVSAAGLYSIVDIRGIETGSVEVTNNTISNYSTIGVLSMASKNVNVEGNTFSPLSTANSFVSLMANSKLMTNGVQATTYANDISVKGNTFNAGTASTGTAIMYADHYGVTTPAFESDLSIGGATEEEKNTFSSDLGKFIVLDALEGTSTAFPLWADYSETTMRPFDQNVTALIVNNNYGLGNSQLIEAMNTDSLDNQDLGRVILYYSTVGVEEVTAEIAAIYPNPAADLITIDLSGADKAEITLMDVTGKTVYTGSVQSKESINVSNLNAGVYFVTMTIADQVYSTKIVKN